MKRLLFIVFSVCFLSLSAQGQIYKLDNVYEMGYEGILSYMRVIEGDAPDEHTFILWGYQYHGESYNTAYEVEYYRGGAKETHDFLSSALAFTRKYKDTDRVLSYISGVKVRTAKEMKFRYTFVFDKEGKVCCRLTEKYLAQMFDSFTRFCTENGIRYSE